MKKTWILMMSVLLFVVGCAQDEQGIEFEFEPDPVIYENDQDRPVQQRWVNDGDQRRIQGPKYAPGTKERDQSNPDNQSGFESRIDPRPGVGSPEERDGDSIKNTSQLQLLLDEVVDLTNREREVNGLPTLEIDRELQDVAQEKASDMAHNNYFSHESPTYGSPSDMLEEFNIDYSEAAENIAAGFLEAEDVVNGWMKSKSHRENILNENLTHVGIGFEEGGELETYWTQYFKAE